MCRFKLGSTIILAFAANFNGIGNPAVCDAGEPADTLQHCDSATTAVLIEQILIGSDHAPRTQRVDMIPGESRSMPLFLERGGLWHEPVFLSKRAYWRPTRDSVTIAIHRLVNLEPYLRRRGGDDYATDIYDATIANLVWNPASDSFVTEELLLNTVVFPDNIYYYWDWGGEKTNVRLLNLGTAVAPLLCVEMALTAAHDCETYTHWVNEGLWCRDGDRYVPNGFLELSRRSSRMDDYDRQDIETVHRVEDTDGDGTLELVYARTYIIAADGVQVAFGDVGDIVFEFREGDPPPPRSSCIGNVSGIPPTHGDYRSRPIRRRPTLQPTRIILSDGSAVPTRPHLPALLFPGGRSFGSPNSVARGKDWATYVGPPTGGGHTIRMGLDHLRVFKEASAQGGHRTTLAFRLVDDSVEFEVAIYPKTMNHPEGADCPGAKYAVILWFDTDLLSDFTSPLCSEDDIAFVVHTNPDDSTIRIEGARLKERQGRITLIPFDERIGSFTPTRQSDYWPQTLRWRLARHEIGLRKRDGVPIMCGFAAEITCSGDFAEDGLYYLAGGLTYPRRFHRTDPSTWSTLMIATRKDTVYTSRY